MLTVFLSDLGGARPLGVLGEGLGGGGSCDVEGALRLVGVLEADRFGRDAAMLLVLLRVFVTGKAGSAMFGGPLEGRAGRGRVVVIVGKQAQLTGVTRVKTLSGCRLRELLYPRNKSAPHCWLSHTGMETNVLATPPVA